MAKPGKDKTKKMTAVPAAPQSPTAPEQAPESPTAEAGGPEASPGTGDADVLSQEGSPEGADETAAPLPEDAVEVLPEEGAETTPLVDVNDQPGGQGAPRKAEPETDPEEDPLKNLTREELIELLRRQKAAGPVGISSSGKRMRVRARQILEYNGVLRIPNRKGRYGEPQDVFDLKKEEDFNPVYMVPLGWEPKKKMPIARMKSTGEIISAEEFAQRAMEKTIDELQKAKTEANAKLKAIEQEILRRNRATAQA